MITQRLVKHLFDYVDGELRRRNPTGTRHKSDSVAGSINNRGYVHVKINRKKYLAHRLIYLYHHGTMPDFIDHIDGNKLNNRIENLRECTKSQNGFNMRMNSNNTSGVKGVSWNEQRQKWVVHLRLNHKQKYFGGFKDFELAELVAIEARNKYHKEFARHD